MRLWHSNFGEIYDAEGRGEGDGKDWKLPSYSDMVTKKSFSHYKKHLVYESFYQGDTETIHCSQKIEDDTRVPDCWVQKSQVSFNIFYRINGFS